MLRSPRLQDRQPVEGDRPTGDYARARLLVKPWEGGRKFGTLDQDACALGLAWRGLDVANSGAVVTGVVASGYPMAIVGVVQARNVSDNKVLTTWGNVSDGRRIQIDVNAGSLRAIQVGSSTQSLATPIAANTWPSFVYIARSATDRAFFVNGRLVGTGSASCTTSAFDRVGVLFNVNNAYPTGTQEINGSTAFLAYLAHRLSDAEARSLSANPWQLFEPSRRIWMPQEAASGSNVTLSIDDAGHGHSAETISLVTGSVLAVADAAHAITSDSIALDASTSVELDIADADHAHAADSLALSTQLHLSIADADHSHTATEPTLSTPDSLALDIEDASHGHAADAISLTSGSVLAIADASHAHAAEEPSLPTAVWLSISDALHGHQAGEPALTESGGGGAVDIPPQRRLRAIPGGSTAYRVPSSQTDFCALDF